MTDSQPPKATPARRPAAAKAPAAKTTAAAKASGAKPAAAKTTAAPKTAAARGTAAKTTAAKPTPAKTPAKTAATKAPAATASAPAAFAPVEPAVIVQATATAPAGWYQVSPGSATQRYWDGSAWTEHIHHPAAAAAAAAPAAAQPAHGHRVSLKAPEGTSATTVWFWLTVGSMAISIAYWIVTQVYFQSLIASNDSQGSPATADTLFNVSILLGLVSVAAFIVFPVFDWLALRKRGVPKPFNWAWSLFAILLSSPIVYVIGRAVVTKRRTGKGLAPLWVFIALQVITFILAVVVLVTVSIAILEGLGDLLSDAGEVL